MTFQPLIQTPFIIQFHVIFVRYRILLGPISVFRKRWDRAYKITEHSWVLAISLVSLSSFWIQEIKVFNPFSPIHILSLATLIGLYQGFRLVRQRRFVEHSRQMQMLFFSLCLPRLGLNLMAAVLAIAESWWNFAAPKLSRQWGLALLTGWLTHCSRRWKTVAKWHV